MPELPEVEVTRRSFADRIAGALVLSVRVGKPLRWALGCDPVELAGRRVVVVRRRGKYLLIELDEGLLLVHLGMSGSLAFAESLPPPGPHDHFELLTDRGVLRLHDPRRFGAVVFAPDEASSEAQKLLGHLGVEPLSDDFDPMRFYAGLHLRNTAVKQVLLGGELVVGVGNIYCSEALFGAGIRPTMKASRISRPRAERLWRAIREVLARAVEAGGSTLRDFQSAEGRSGYFQLQAMVYGREGLPCHVCATPVRAIKQGQRSTFFCPNCQKS
ncbi:bifunctional DNA-formamidopyrimidine glycosylase/DNA-(apurinic or apyrimidinic site) lyase [Xylophilus rhododendri]|uniref:Formamidopyrimidine-DNA glycosylase n=1 Tax=Xylophilus rhododendri TaxID=2697032 RepID=A0A857J634_9BURK|nr:bifunctional DNA-formamidopyrimidine glycosylase/DNA-(apurinic or apyrimidinic site) lyase [Xylophilus rhododendri]QHI99440.1 bifunctional DNA-formamidopyrimidine glycosylase/DNA-(apurinic or apyrimidinic site) lyase [Xylophilus rhododendri]